MKRRSPVDVYYCKCLGCDPEDMPEWAQQSMTRVRTVVLSVIFFIVTIDLFMGKL